ncbi:MAG TPA: DNA mismatch repair endonuclease MutL [Candidatus Brocadiia bacterium]
MPKIKILPPSVTNKIAAGEVIERPASVVKELIENAIDANAARIDVYLEEGGKKLIKVIDDGTGMCPEDLALAFLSHATSKIEKAEDLFDVVTMGFRGEALPSIGAVSQSRIISRPYDTTSGAEIEIEGGVLGKLKECGASSGTQVEVRNLFFNTPVRRKFLKTTPTEMAHISDILTRLSLAFPTIHFTLTHDNRKVFNLPPASDIKERIHTFFGKEIGEYLIPIKCREPNMEVSGYILPQTYDRPNTKMQFTFVNGRYIRSNVVYRAITEAYHGLLTNRRCPIVFMFLQIDPHEVDVNVHPTKIEVRFKNANQVHGVVLSALRGALGKGKTTTPIKKVLSDEVIVSSEGKGIKKYSLTNTSPLSSRPFSALQSTNTELVAPAKQTLWHLGFSHETVLQLHASYIIEETPEGLNIIDQHALHEIILYHEIKQRITQSKLVSQQLLIPELIELSPKDFFTMLNLKDGLERLGMAVEEFGQNTVIIRTLPQILKNLDCKEFVNNLLNEIGDNEVAGDASVVFEKLIKIMACKGAVKAGQKLAVEEIESLLQRRKDFSITSNCPHGRPTTISFSIRELESLFKRR